MLKAVSRLEWLIRHGDPDQAVDEIVPEVERLSRLVPLAIAYHDACAALHDAHTGDTAYIEKCWQDFDKAVREVKGD